MSIAALVAGIAVTLAATLDRLGGGLLHRHRYRGRRLRRRLPGRHPARPAAGTRAGAGRGPFRCFTSSPTSAWACPPLSRASWSRRSTACWRRRRSTEPPWSCSPSWRWAACCCTAPDGGGRARMRRRRNGSVRDLERRRGSDPADGAKLGNAGGKSGESFPILDAIVPPYCRGEAIAAIGPSRRAIRPHPEEGDPHEHHQAPAPSRCCAGWPGRRDGGAGQRGPCVDGHDPGAGHAGPAEARPAIHHR